VDKNKKTNKKYKKTRFCDGCFGLVKRARRRKQVMDPAQFHALVNDSSRVNTGKSSTSVQFYDWKFFLEQFFKATVTRISDVHHLLFDDSTPGTVKHRTWFTKEWSETSLLKPGVTAAMVRDPAAYGEKPLNECFLAPKRPTEERIKQLVGMARQYQPLAPGCTDEEYVQRHPWFQSSDPEAAAAAAVAAAQ
jgi:hypothetical protein